MLDTARYARGLLAVYMFSINSIIASSLRVLYCIPVSNRGLVIQAFPSVPCKGEGYGFLRIGAISALALYLVVVPAAVLVGVTFTTDSFACAYGAKRKYFGVLYEPFRFSFWWLYLVSSRVCC